MKRINITLFLFLLIGLFEKGSSQTNGLMYGLTSNQATYFGTIFDIDTIAGKDTIYFKEGFQGNQGKTPFGNLMQATNGLLYGMTSTGGVSNVGVLFDYNPTSNTSNVLFTFDVTHGATPYGSLVQASNGILYGMTSAGGKFGGGVLFSFDPLLSKYTDIYDFNSASGATPYGNLIQASNGLLYGMTNLGGASNGGVIFSFNITTSQYTLLSSFNGTNGAYPYGSLVQISNGLLYGMANQGGASNDGVIFTFDTTSNTETVVYNFDDIHGRNPYGSLMQATNGLLYGMVYNNSSAYGNLFSFNPVSLIDSVLFVFNQNNGASPKGSLIQASDGLLYGMTSLGGTSSNAAYSGVIFRCDTSGKHDTVLFNLDVNGPCGVNPGGDLLEVMTASLITKDNKCFGDSAGLAIMRVRGGHYPLKYSWSNGATTDTIKGLKAGSYSASVIDLKGITYNFNFTIKQPPLLIDSIKKQTNILCYGGNNGNVSIAVKGGTKPYVYAWSAGLGTSSSVSNLIAGSYTFTATDSNSCITPVTITITQPPLLKDSTVSSTNVKCNGSNSGKAIVGVIGGTTPYSYTWSPSIATNAIANNIIAGTYTCVIKDFNKCSTTDTITITQPPKINTITSYTATPCSKNVGAASVSVSGGVSPYIYSWSNGNTNALDTALPASSYTCIVTDSLGCTRSPVVTVPNIGGPKDSLSSSTNVSCNGGSNGTATVFVSGGKLPYTYNWSPSGGSSLMASGLIAGAYTFTATDSIGCTGIVAIVITQPLPIRDSIAMQHNVSCYGGNNGNAKVGVTGGTTPYSYSWSPSGGTTMFLDTAIVGTYTCTITDINKCTASQVVVSVTSPAAIVIDTIATVTKCGKHTGAATVIVSGGVTPYAYSWSPGGETSASVTNLAEGTYTCIVIDSLNCLNTVNIVVADTGGPKVVITPNSSIACYGQKTGSAVVNVTGGVSPYTYQWSLGAGTNSFAINLAAGAYTCAVTDSSGCTVQSAITIMQPAKLNVITQTIGVCFGSLSGGAAIVYPSGGTSPYTYNWSTGSTTDSIAGVGPGSYVCTVTDFNGCNTSAVPYIGAAGKMKIDSFVVHDASCNACNDGWIQVYVSGGVPPGDTVEYHYSWSTIPVQTTALATGIDTGTYCVNVTSWYCDETLPCDTAIVVVGIQNLNNSLQGVKVYPVPSNGYVNIQIPRLEQAVISIFDELGNKVYNKQINAGAVNNTESINLNYLPNGIYALKITSDKGTVIKKIVLQK